MSLKVLCWYPAGMHPRGFRKKYLAGLNYHSIFFRSATHDRYPISGLKTNSFEESDLLSTVEVHPVIVFTHDVGYRPEYYTTLLEYLAAQGYVVFCLQHAPELSRYSILPLKRSGFPAIAPMKGMISIQWQLALRQIQLLTKEQTYARWEKLKQMTQRLYHFGDELFVWARQNQRLINYVKVISKESASALPTERFHGRLNTDRIFAIGHGWGGAVSAINAQNDKHIGAVVNLNGFQFGTVVNQIYRTPLLMIYAEPYAGMNDIAYFPFPERKPEVIEGSSHASFSDLMFWEKESDQAEWPCSPLYTAMKQIGSFLKDQRDQFYFARKSEGMDSGVALGEKEA